MQVDEKTLRTMVREEVARALRDWSPPMIEQDKVQFRRLLSLREAAVYLDVAEATLRDWRVDRKGPPAVKYGRLVKYRLEDLEHWVLGGRPV